MAIYAAVDSNALTYLVNAIFEANYDPVRDSSGLADQRVGHGSSLHVWRLQALGASGHQE
jgi:hypothetical protein